MPKTTKRRKRGVKPRSNSKRRRYFYWKYRKNHPERFQKGTGSSFVKPLSKEEAAAARKANITNDEFRYEQACSWAILMGEQLPDKREFMANLARKRAKK